MHTLLLIAALANQITFNTTQQGDMYTIIPQVTLTQPCVCEVQASPCHTKGPDKLISSYENKPFGPR